MSRLRRPFLLDRYFFVTVRRDKERAALDPADFRAMALAFNRARTLHPFFLTAWVFLPDHWHAICAPEYPLTISLVMKSIKNSSTALLNRQRHEVGEVWQARFFDRALRTVKEYNETVEYIHWNPVRRRLAKRTGREKSPRHEQTVPWLPARRLAVAFRAGDMQNNVAATRDRVKRQICATCYPLLAIMIPGPWYVSAAGPPGA